MNITNRFIANELLKPTAQGYIYSKILRHYDGNPRVKHYLDANLGASLLNYNSQVVGGLSTNNLLPTMGVEEMVQTYLNAFIQSTIITIDTNIISAMPAPTQIAFNDGLPMSRYNYSTGNQDNYNIGTSSGDPSQCGRKDIPGMRAKTPDETLRGWYYNSGTGIGKAFRDDPKSFGFDSKPPQKTPTQISRVQPAPGAIVEGVGKYREPPGERLTTVAQSVGFEGFEDSEPVSWDTAQTQKKSISGRIVGFLGGIFGGETRGKNQSEKFKKQSEGFEQGDMETPGNMSKMPFYPRNSSVGPLSPALADSTSFVVDNVQYADQDNIGLNQHLLAYENTPYKEALNRTPFAHERTPLGVYNPAADDRLLSRRVMRNGVAGEGSVPHYETWLYNRHYERDIGDTLSDTEYGCQTRGYDMTSLISRQNATFQPGKPDRIRIYDPPIKPEGPKLPF